MCESDTSVRAAQPHGIEDDAHRGHGHRRGSEHRVEKPEDRERNHDDVVEEGPEKVFFDDL